MEQLAAGTEVTEKTVIRVGDVVGIPGRGAQEVKRISIALVPHEDRAAETHSVEVEECALALPIVIDTADGHWAYGHQITDLLRHVEA